MFTLSTDAQRWLFPVLNTNITCVLLLLNMLSYSLIVCVSVCCPLLTDSSALSSTSVPHIIPILSLLERGMALGETLEPWESAEVGVDVVMHHLEAARTIAHHGGIYRTTAETKLQGKTLSNGAFSSINRWRQEAETFVLMYISFPATWPCPCGDEFLSITTVSCITTSPLDVTTAYWSLISPWWLPVWGVYSFYWPHVNSYQLSSLFSLISAHRSAWPQSAPCLLARVRLTPPQVAWALFLNIWAGTSSINMAAQRLNCLYMFWNQQHTGDI